MMQIWINKKNKLVKKSTYGAIDGFVFEPSEVDDVDPFVESFVEASASGAVGAVGVVGFPDASVEEDENNENVFPNIPFPEASVTGVGFPDASVDDENNENDSKFGENNASILVVPPNNDESISFYKSVSFKYLLYYNYN